MTRSISASLTIPALRGGGLVLGYRCSSRCRHCLYACGPHRRDGGPPAGQGPEPLLELLAERAPRASFHIGGGEPFLDLELLQQVIEGMHQRGLRLEYVETNASWVKNARQAGEVLQRLRGAGLACVLVSLSPFHAEFIPLQRTLALIEAANHTLPGGAFVWIQGFIEDLRDHPPHQRLDLDRHLAARGASYARQLAARYSLVPAGRAGRYLHHQGQRRPWHEAAASGDCLSRLTSTSHFHVDLQKAYVPGLCAGITLPLSHVPGPIDLGRYPLLSALVRGGVAELVELAAAEGFKPHPDYASACDLCTHVRCFLYPQGHAELGPPGFYDHRSLEYR